MWNADTLDTTSEAEELFVPLGSTLPNPTRNNAPVLTIDFGVRSRDLVFPDSDMIDGSGVRRNADVVSGPDDVCVFVLDQHYCDVLLVLTSTWPIIIAPFYFSSAIKPRS